MKINLRITFLVLALAGLLSIITLSCTSSKQIQVADAVDKSVPGDTLHAKTNVPLKSGALRAVTAWQLGGRVDAIDIAAGTAQTISSTVHPAQIAITGKPARLYVVDASNKHISVLDQKGKGIGSVDLNNAPVIPSSNSVPAPLLSLYTPILQYIYAPVGITITDGGKMYVPAMFSITVVEKGIPTRAVMDIDVSGGQSVPGLDLPVNTLGAFRAAHTHGKVFVTNFLSDTVTVIDAVTDTIPTTITVGSGPSGIAASPTGVVYVTCTFSGEVWPIDPATNTAGSPISVGVGPIDIAFDSTGSYAYVSNFLSGDISVIETGGGLLIATLNASSLPSLMNALGLTQGGMQAMLQQMRTSLGLAPGPVPLSGLGSYVTNLMGITGVTQSADIIPALLAKFLSAFYSQLQVPGAPSQAGAMPDAGVWGIEIVPESGRLVVANSATGEVVVIDPATNMILHTAIPGIPVTRPVKVGFSSVAVY